MFEPGFKKNVCFLIFSFQIIWAIFKSANLNVKNRFITNFTRINLAIIKLETMLQYQLDTH